MDDQKKVVAIALTIIVVIGIAGAIYYFAVMRRHSGGAAEAPEQAGAPRPSASETSGGIKSAAGETSPLPPVALDESDPVVRDRAAGLSSDSLFANWLKTKDLVRTFVVIVDNIANDQNPKSHIDFFSPAGKFKVISRTDGLIIDASGFARYNPVADVVASMDAAAAAGFYRALKPLIQDAYKDLGYPGVNFDDTLIQAMGKLLEIPVVEGPVRVEQKVLSFTMTDETLEELSPAQKQLLRMGPKNVMTIQAKIREVAKALGIAESRLPRTPAYTPPGQKR